ncbi:hypothetical protein Tco_0803341 [Tanacetum coccineum]|uniref:Uncharacterized protein n=1 Tax=Tanacetum coccineum TaxID=301880 RepID=A0ABQ5A1G3_9ASTR
MDAYPWHGRLAELAAMTGISCWAVSLGIRCCTSEASFNTLSKNSQQENSNDATITSESSFSNNSGPQSSFGKEHLWLYQLRYCEDDFSPTATKLGSNKDVVTKVVDHEEIDHEKGSLADYILWLSQLSEAINCFSKENKHGEAGYGRVYKEGGEVNKYYSIYRIVGKLAHEIQNRAAFVEGVEAKLWQDVFDMEHLILSLSIYGSDKM